MSKKMKDSGIEWIGEIPEEWEVISCKFFFTIYNGSDPTTKYGDTPVYGSGSKSFKTCGEYKDGPTVLLGRKGTVNIPQWIEGKYWNVDTAFDVKPKGNYNLRLFFYVAICFDYEKYSTQTALPSMTQADYNGFKLPYMSREEQQHIANYLDKKCSKIDSLTADIQKQIEILEQYKKSVITETVTKGLDPNVKMKNSGIEWIGEIPEEWEARKIKYMFNVFSGSTPKSDNCDYWDGDVTWVTPADYKTCDKYIENGGRNISKLGLQSCSTTLVPKGSIIFSKRAPIGTVAIAEVDLCTNQGCLSCISRQGVYPLFYYYVLSIATEDFELKGSGTTFKEISTTAFNDSQLPFPPFSVQQQIASYLDSKSSKIDELIRLKNQQLETLAQYKKSLIYECVTGKRELN